MLSDRSMAVSAEGLALARRFDQNAVVFIERGQVPRLAFPEAQTS